MENKTKISDLDYELHCNKDILRKLDYPSSTLDYIWWASSWVTGARYRLRILALNRIDKIKKEIESLRK